MMNKSRFRSFVFILAGLMVLQVLGPDMVQGQEMVKKSKGQKIMIPVHPHIFIDDRGATIDLTTSLMVYNTDQEQPIELTSLQFRDLQGKMVKEYLAGPRELGPLSSFVLLVKTPGLKGRGPGGSILILWSGRGQSTNAPLIEAISIGAQGNQGISFHNTGIVLEETSK